MITVDVKGVSQLSSKLKKIQKKLDKVPTEAHKVFVANTPIRTGNARRNTKLKKEKIKANYPYAKRLDEGYSQQFPEGMTKPTLEYIKKRVKQILAGK